MFLEKGGIMRIKTPTILVIIVLILLVLPARSMQGQETQTDKLASWTIQRIIKDAEENKKLKGGLKYRESFIEEEYDTNGRSRSRKEGTKIIDGSKKFQIAGFEFNLYEILPEIYNFKLASTAESVGLAIIDENIYVAIDFIPKTNLKYRRLEDRFIYRFRGRIFVDISGERYYIKKMEIRIPEEFSFTYWQWGFIPIPITIKSFELIMIQDRLDPEDIIVEKSIKAKVVFSSLRSGNRNYDYTYDGFEHKK